MLTIKLADLERIKKRLNRGRLGSGDRASDILAINHISASRNNADALNRV